MTSNEIRRQFLEFFEKRGHKIVPSSSLIPTDPSVLFTTAGMQQFKLYFLGEKSPWGPNVASVQKCIRTSDIDEVGDETHLTFFEMLGNFSFGGYWKREAIRFAWEFLEGVTGDDLKSQISNLKSQISNLKTQNSKLKTQNSKFEIRNLELLITVFGGDDEVPADEESYRIWRDEIGIPENLIKRCGREDNFWGPTGAEGPCGPTTEIHINGTEIWNIVFNEYYCDKSGKLTLLKQKGVDTGMGLERLAMILQNKATVFETDLFEPIITILSDSNAKAQNSKLRIIADHMKAVVFLAGEGILPSNLERGYVLRRLLRRAIRFAKVLKLSDNALIEVINAVMNIYSKAYPELLTKQAEIVTVIQNEKEKFERVLVQGMKQFEKLAKKGVIEGKEAFHLYDTYGFPLEFVEELAREYKVEVDKEGFNKAFSEHQRISAIGQQKKFGGHGLILDTGELKAVDEEEIKKVTRLHTATHLLQAALRQVLGTEVRQAGSDITAERTRFDFTFPRKLTPEELAKVEKLVQKKIDENLRVKMKEMSFKEAIAQGALTVPGARYPERVKVYSIGDFSKEVCGGPHVEFTGQVGKFKILKQEAVAAGVRRIRATVE